MDLSTLLGSIFVTAEREGTNTGEQKNESRALEQAFTLALKRLDMESIHKAHKELIEEIPFFEAASDVIGEDFGESYEGGEEAPLYGAIVAGYYISTVEHDYQLQDAIRIAASKLSESAFDDYVDTLKESSWFTVINNLPFENDFDSESRENVLACGMVASIKQEHITFALTGFCATILKENMNIREKNGAISHYFGGVYINFTRDEAKWLSKHVPDNCCDVDFRTIKERLKDMQKEEFAH